MFVSILTDSLELEYALDVASKSFIPIYLLEIMLKITNFGIRTFLEEGWNTFDLILVFISFIFDIILIEIVFSSEMSESNNAIFRLSKVMFII